MLLVGIIISLTYFVSDAYAYIDPGTGTIIIQAIIGALVGIGVTLKLFWHRIEEKLTKKPF